MLGRVFRQAKKRQLDNALKLCFARPYATHDPPIVSIDRSGLFNVDPKKSVIVEKEQETALAKHLKALIQFRGGPITLAEYMSEVLTNPTAGYYMNRDVFGQSGDFITSPEISQLFGEMIGIWAVLQWQQLGAPAKVRLVEVGPGRGTLMADLLRGTKTLQSFASSVDVHFVEVSKALREIQAQTVTEEQNGLAVSAASGAPIMWHRSIEEVPADAPAIFILHEFFDALPVHQFQKTERGWCERLVDIAGPATRQHFEMVLSPRGTPASSLLVQRRLDALSPGQRSDIKQMEVSVQSIATAASIAKRIEQQGGAAIVVDYGQDGIWSNSLQAIRNHNFVHPLSCPGEADLSCRVDFAALRQGVKESGAKVAAHGPIPQAHFLAGMGIEARLEALLKDASPAEQESLLTGFKRLVGGADSQSDLQQPGIEEGIIKGQEGNVQNVVDFAKGMARVEDAILKDAERETGKKGEKEEEEGMGYSYKVMAFNSAEAPLPIPFV